MKQKLRKLRWEFYQHNLGRKIPQYYHQGKINLYDDALIAKLREVYYLGVPGSIVLLSRELCKGQCRARAALMAKALLNTNDDVRLIYADVNGLLLNPKYEAWEAEHCFVERLTPEGQDIIYDTTDGFVYDKAAYWHLEKPRINQIKNRAEIISDLKAFDYLYQPIPDPQFDAIAARAIKRSFEIGESDDFEAEPYAATGKLQHELDLYKIKIKENDWDKNF